MKKALIITTISGFVPQFEQKHIQILQNMGYQIHYASNFQNPHYGTDNHRLKGTGIICHQIDFVRSPFLILENWRAYWQLKRLLKKISFDVIHCHTPMGGVLGRLAADYINKNRRKIRRKIWYSRSFQEDGNKTEIRQIQVIYTAHGFHFFSGAPIINWLFYYPAEYWLAKKTDVLITINREDYLRASKFHLKQGGMVWKVNGVGISVFSYPEKKSNRESVRRAFGILPNEYIFLSVGELSRRKNHQVVIKALKKLAEKRENSCIRYFICGEGRERSYLEKLIQKNSLEKQVMLMGYQEKISLFLQAADCFIFPSLQEGLPVALLEAMQEGLPIIASKIRGNFELVEGEAILVKADDRIQYAKAMQQMMQKKGERRIYTKLEQYSEPYVTKQMQQIYKESLKEV